LKKFKYTNARTTDLWDALKDASGVDVASLMETWTLKMGYPVVQVLKETYNDVTKEMTLDLKQSRFLSSGDLSSEEEAASPIWWIPLGIITDTSNNTPLELILTEKEGKVTFPFVVGSDSFYKLNYRYTGLFRVQMLDARVKSLAKQISTKPASFAVSDRYINFSRF